MKRIDLSGTPFPPGWIPINRGAKEIPPVPLTPRAAPDMFAVVSTSIFRDLFLGSGFNFT